LVRRQQVISEPWWEKMMTDDAAWPLVQQVCRAGYADLPASAVESTHRWREVDSNLRFPNRSAPISRQPGPVSHYGLISRPGTDGSNPPPSSGESGANSSQSKFGHSTLAELMPNGYLVRRTSEGFRR